MIERFASYEDVIDAGPDGVSVSDVVFKMDFGPWKKGQKIDSLSLCEDELAEWSYDGKKRAVCKVMLVPVDD
jgi:hypothetical protein